LLGIVPPRGGVLERHQGGRPGAVGFVPQHSTLARTLPTTVREVVQLGLAGLPLGRRDAETRTREALERVGLHALANAVRRSWRRVSNSLRR
jgi:ABC-type Mn2+/Zn2+ transport system ATPase subunit